MIFFLLFGKLYFAESIFISSKFVLFIPFSTLLLLFVAPLQIILVLILFSLFLILLSLQLLINDPNSESLSITVLEVLLDNSFFKSFVLF